MRGLLIAKDDPPCGTGSRFPRAPTTSDNDAIRYAEASEGGEETELTSPGGK